MTDLPTPIVVITVALLLVCCAVMCGGTTALEALLDTIADWFD